VKKSFFLQRRTLPISHVWGKFRTSIVFLIILSFLTSCVSAKYKMAGEDTPPPVPLNLSAEAYFVNAQIDSVIIYGGPGSWKREAYWDEYLLTITNHDEHPVDLISATIIDFQGNPVTPGDKPWELQEQSKEWIKNYDSGTTGLVLKVGAATMITGAAVGGIILATTTPYAILAGAAAPAAAGAVVVAAYAAPVIIGTIIVNANRKHKIEDEFSRRRLVLPATIQPGQMIQGSLFFRISPGPQRLMLLFTGVDREFDTTIALAPLSDLHIDTTPESKQIEQSRITDEKLQ
jgi:hypothetical protein